MVLKHPRNPAKFAINLNIDQLLMGKDFCVGVMHGVGVDSVVTLGSTMFVISNFVNNGMTADSRSQRPPNLEFDSQLFYMEATAAME